MNAITIEYSPDETQMALGMPTGLVEIKKVNGADGSPGDLISEITAHKTTVIFLAFLDEDRLISVDAAGTVLISYIDDGYVDQTLEMGGKYVSAALSPSGETLFVFAFKSEQGKNKIFALNTEDLQLTAGPEVKDLSVSAQVIALDDDRAAFRYLAKVKGSSNYLESLAFVNFKTGEVELKSFPDGPADDMSPTSLMVADSKAKIGVRFAYGRPLEIEKDSEGIDRASLYLEVFSLETLESLRQIKVFEEEVDVDDFDGGPTKRKYQRALNNLVTEIDCARLVRNAEEIWVSFHEESLRRIPLDGTEPSGLITHDETDIPPEFIDKSTPYNGMDRATLGVSPGGKYIAFATPNAFFSREILSAEPQSIAPWSDENQVQAPLIIKFMGRNNSIFCAMADDEFLLLNYPERKIEYRYQGPSGEEFQGADLSPNGSQLTLNYHAAQTRRLNLNSEGESKYEELPILPGVKYTKYLSDEKVVFAQQFGAAVLLEGNLFSAYRNEDDSLDNGDGDAPYKETATRDPRWNLKSHPDTAALGLKALFGGGEPEDYILYNEYFEDQHRLYDAAHFNCGGQDYMAAQRDNGPLEVYRFGKNRIHFSGSIKTSLKQKISAAGNRIVAYSPKFGGLDVIHFSAEGLRQEHDLEKEGLVMAELSVDGETLYLFNKIDGLLTAMDMNDGSEKPLLSWKGAGFQDIHLSPENQKLIITDGRGDNIIVDLKEGRTETGLRIQGRGESRSLEFFEPDTVIEFHK